MKKLILHIDDEGAIREILAAFLEQQGYRVVSVPTPTGALKAVAQDRPDLIICDLQLGEGDGWEVIGQLKALLPETPVLMLSGVLIDPRILQQTLGHKVSGYVEKTAPLSRISEEVKRLIGD